MDPPEEDLVEVPQDLPASVLSTAAWIFDFRAQKTFVGTSSDPGTTMDLGLTRSVPRIMIVYNRGNATWTIRRGSENGRKDTLGAGPSTIKLGPVTDYVSLTPDAAHPPNAGDLTILFFVKDWANEPTHLGE